MAGSTIYNSTDGPLLVDDDGRVLGGRDRLDGVDVSVEPVAGHLKAGRLVLIDEPQDTAEAPQEADPDPEQPAPRRGRRTSTPTSTQEA